MDKAWKEMTPDQRLEIIADSPKANASGGSIRAICSASRM
jgi:TusA-related sulfurtransferase